MVTVHGSCVCLDTIPFVDVQSALQDGSRTSGLRYSGVPHILDPHATPSAASLQLQPKSASLTSPSGPCIRMLSSCKRRNVAAHDVCSSGMGSVRLCGAALVPQDVR